MDIVNTAKNSVEDNAKTLINLFIPLVVGTIIVTVVMSARK